MKKLFVVAAAAPSAALAVLPVAVVMVGSPHQVPLRLTRTSHA